MLLILHKVEMAEEILQVIMVVEFFVMMLLMMKQELLLMLMHQNSSTINSNERKMGILRIEDGILCKWKNDNEIRVLHKGA